MSPRARSLRNSAAVAERSDSRPAKVGPSGHACTSLHEKAAHSIVASSDGELDPVITNRPAVEIPSRRSLGMGNTPHRQRSPQNNVARHREANPLPAGRAADTFYQATGFAQRMSSRKSTAAQPLGSIRGGWSRDVAYRTARDRLVLA